MRAKDVCRDTEGDSVAERLVSVAESQSIEALGFACCEIMGEITGSQAVGLYLFDGDEPALIYSGHVSQGLLASYKSGFWRNDPVLKHVCSTGSSADGATLAGTDNWQRSPTFDALREWGFGHHMGGPLRYGDRIVGVMYTAATSVHTPYTPAHRRRMDLVCRAGSLAIANMINLGQIRASDVPIVLRQYHQGMASRASLPLSPRLTEVAVRLCRGYTNKEIAREIGISDQTVKDHVATLCRRFRVNNRTRLAAILIEGGAA